MPVPIESRVAAVLLSVVAFGWALLPTPWLMWWMIVRGRLPVLPLIGEPNGGPFYLNYSHAVFVVLLAAAFVLGLVQVWVGWLLWNGERWALAAIRAPARRGRVLVWVRASHSADPRARPRRLRGDGLAATGLKPELLENPRSAVVPGGRRPSPQGGASPPAPPPPNNPTQGG